MRDSFRRCVEWLLPEICALCRVECSEGFCPACRRAVRRVPEACPRCGLPNNDAAAHLCVTIPAVASVTAPFVFEPPLSDCIRALKYRRRRWLARALALLLIDCGSAGLFEGHALVPVPLHPARLRDRTFNQADEIAATLASRTKLPLLPAAACRTVATPAQTTLDPAQRMANLANAFAATTAVQGLDIAIIDDVVTTGATTGSLARALREAGASSVRVWAVARALPAPGVPFQAAPTAAPLRNT